MSALKHSQKADLVWIAKEEHFGYIRMLLSNRLTSGQRRNGLLVSLSKWLGNMVNSSHVTLSIPLVVLAKGDSNSHCPEKKLAVWLAQDTSYLDLRVTAESACFDLKDYSNHPKMPQ